MILLEIQNVSDLMWFRVKENQCRCANTTEGINQRESRRILGPQFVSSVESFAVSFLALESRGILIFL